MNISQNKKIIFAAIGCVLFWASAFVGTRITVQYISPENLALYRFLIASLILAAYAFGIKRIPLPAGKDAPFLILTGFIGVSLYMFVFNTAQKMVTAATGAFILGLAPVFTGIFSSIFLKEGIKSVIVGIIISFCGVILICFSESDGISLNMGIIIMLLAAVIISLYNIMAKKSTMKYTSLQVTAYAIISGTFFLLIFSPSLINEMKNLSLYMHLVIVYLGIFPAAVSNVLWVYALSEGNTSQVASFMYITPLLTIVIGWYWIKEIPSVLSIIGGLIIILGVIFANSNPTGKISRIK